MSLDAQEVENCAGFIFKKRNGHPYCASNVNMNWFSAHAWCHAQGRHLATMNEACDYNDKIYGATYDEGCPNGDAVSVDGTDATYLMKFWINRQDELGNVFYVDLYFASSISAELIGTKARALCY